MCRGGRFSSEAPAEEHHLPTFQGFLLIRDWVTRDLSHFVLPWPREVMCPSHTLKYIKAVSQTRSVPSKLEPLTVKPLRGIKEANELQRGFEAAEGQLGRE